jgi:hypothetical protein
VITAPRSMPAANELVRVLEGVREALCRRVRECCYLRRAIFFDAVIGGPHEQVRVNVDNFRAGIAFTMPCRHGG